MLVGVVVDANLEIDACYVEIVPPVPGDLAGLDPAEIALRSIAQAIDDIVVNHLDVFCADSEYTPGELFAGFALCKIVVAALDNLLDVVVATLLQIFGKGSPYTVQLAGAVTLKIHSRIVVECRLHNVNLDAVRGIYHLRQIGQFLGMDCAEGRILIDVLERGFKPVPGEPCPGVPVAGKVELGSLALYLEGLLALGDEAVSDAVVIGAENYVAIFVVERQFVIMVANLGLLVCDGFEGFIGAAP